MAIILEILAYIFFQIIFEGIIMEILKFISKIIRRLKYLFFIVVLLSQISCTIPTGFYIQNLTERTIVLKVTFQKPYKEFIVGEGINFYNIQEITNLRQLRHIRNTTKLDFIKIDEKTFVINLPPNSTTDIEQTRNFNYNIDKIEFDGKNRDLGELIANSKIKKDNYIYQIK